MSLKARLAVCQGSEKSGETVSGILLSFPKCSPRLPSGCHSACPLVWVDCEGTVFGKQAKTCTHIFFFCHRWLGILSHQLSPKEPSGCGTTGLPHTSHLTGAFVCCPRLWCGFLHLSRSGLLVATHQAFQASCSDEHVPRASVQPQIPLRKLNAGHT